MVVEFATFLQPALQPVFDKLFKLGENKLSTLLVNGENEVKKWNNQLDRIREWLDHAEQKQFSNKVVKHLLWDVQDVVYDMEDVLDRLAIQDEKNELDQQQRVLQTVVNAAQNTVIQFTDKKIRRKIEKITKRLDDILERATTLQLPDDSQPKTLQTEALRSKRESSSLASKMFVGRDAIKQKIVTQLLRNNLDDQRGEIYVMIPIVGMGGIGKTTLAQHVYNDERLKEHFYCKAWVCVSDVFDVQRITTSIIKEFDRDAAAVKFSNLQQAQSRLEDLVMDKKFLIVLDDVWKDEDYCDWKKLQEPFEKAAKGSRVIMTTRNEASAKLMNTSPEHDNIIKLERLSDDDCWNIVQHHAKNKTGLIEMRADIIIKCKGLPLAAAVIGGELIKPTKYISECRDIFKNDCWGKNASEIFPDLRLSYHHLPPELKQIFAYCSIFPKDYKFKEEFVLLCMALGFLRENNSKSMETIGQENLWDLVSRSLLEVVGEGGPSSEKRFKMHDLIRDLALQVAGDICHVMDPNDIVAEKRARHVSLTANATTTIRLPHHISSQLRTLYCYSYAHVNFITSFSCIRALSLDSNEVKELPEGISHLKHLRFLKLECVYLKKLPRSISKLRNLQTLWLDGRLNNTDLNLPSSLRYLRIRGLPYLESISYSTLPNLITFSIEGCPKFKFCGDNVRPPQLQIVRLSDVESEEDIALPSSLSEIFISENPKLKNLSVADSTNLTTLVLLRCQNLETLVGNFTSLRELNLMDCPKLKDLSVVDSTNLTSLVLLGCQNLETLVGNFTSLRELNLTDCPKLNSLPRFIQMITLENLTLWKLGSSADSVVEIPGPGLHLPSSLHSLKIGGLQNLKSMNCFALTNLACLEIKYCHKFKIFGDNALPPQLPEVIIEGCELINPQLRSDPNGRIRVGGDRYSLP